MRWNSAFNADRQTIVSLAMGHPGVDAADVIENLIRSLGLPTRLRELNVALEDLPRIAAKSLHDPGMQRNPRPVAAAGAALGILRLAW
jgi:maleylacetate reductase